MFWENQCEKRGGTDCTIAEVERKLRDRGLSLRQEYEQCEKSGTGDITPVPFDGVIKESFRPDDYPDMPGRSWPELFRFLFLHPVWREGQ